jgi:hypothetical protein
MVTTRSKNFILCEESFLETNREEVRCGEIGPGHLTTPPACRNLIGQYLENLEGGCAHSHICLYMNNQETNLEFGQMGEIGPLVPSASPRATYIQ